MKLPNQLSTAEMEQIIGDIQALLWLDLTKDDDCWEPDKEWDCETLEYVAAVLEDHGLRPDEEFSEPTVVVDRISNEIW